MHASDAILAKLRNIAHQSRGGHDKPKEFLRLEVKCIQPRNSHQMPARLFTKNLPLLALRENFPLLLPMARKSYLVGIIGEAEHQPAIERCVIGERVDIPLDRQLDGNAGVLAVGRCVRRF